MLVSRLILPISALLKMGRSADDVAITFHGNRLAQTFSHLDPVHSQSASFAHQAALGLPQPLSHTMVQSKIIDHIDCLAPPKSDIGQLQQAAWDIARDPSVARLVKEISFDSWRPPYVTEHFDELRKHEQAPSKDDYSGAMDQRVVTDDLKQDVLTELECDNPMGHLAFLLIMCTEIESLNVPASPTHWGELITRILIGVGDAGPPHHSVDGGKLFHLRALQRLFITPSWAEIPLKVVLPLLRLPALRELRVNGMIDTAWSWPELLPTLPTEPLNHNPMSFVLDSCTLSGAGLSLLLSSCAGPVGLTVRWSGSIINENLTAQAIGDAVRESGRTLEYLHIDTTKLDKLLFRMSEGGGFGNFKGLKRLKLLALPRAALTAEGWGVDAVKRMLPDGLEKLYVLGVDQEQRGRMEEMAHQLKEELPGLWEVVLVGWHAFEYGEWYGTARDRSVDYDELAEEDRLALTRYELR